MSVHLPKARLKRVMVASTAAIAAIGAGIGMATIAHAERGIELSRAIYIEKTSKGSRGKTRSLEPATQIRAGDKLVMVVEWRGPASPKPFTISSRIPSTLAFQRASSDAVEVSVDGGKSWGKIGELKIGRRLATPEDVTNLRWPVSSRRAANGTGRLSYSALVRR